MTAPLVDEDGRCVCCELPVESCGRAADALARRQAMLDRQRLAARGAFPAAYAGRCSACGEPFGPGTLLLPGTDRTTYRAECCA